MPYGTVNADTLVTSTPQGVLGAGNASIMKNRIINGAMVISQYNGTTQVTPAAGAYVIDRFLFSASQASKFTSQQLSASPPAGHTNYLGLVSTAATSVGAGDFYGISQRIEGYNIADLGFGTANAKTITLSFWVQSSLTGTFSGSLVNGNFDTGYGFTYSIPTANTWTQISVTIAGSTTGTWNTTNGNGMRVYFSLGVGSTFATTANTWVASGSYGVASTTNVVATNGATFYITGVQLEVGSSATGFEYRQYQQELALCQRYFCKVNAIAYTTAYTYSQTFPTTMRAEPTNTVVISAGTGATYGQNTGATTGFYQSTGNSAIGNATISFSAEL